MKRITADSTVEEIMKEIGVGEGEELRESQKRENTLSKFAQMRSRNPQTSLTLRESPTAFVQVDEELEEFVDITIPTQEFEQKKTNLPEDYNDYLNQKAFTAHEVGHILYSDWKSLEHFHEKVKEDELSKEGIDESMAESYKKMFSNFFNVFEDGAIEKFLSEDYLLDEELTHLRSNLHEDNYMGQEYEVEGVTEYHYPFFFALMVAAINIGVYDNGELDKLIDENNEQYMFAPRGGEVDREMFIDECLPAIQSYVPKIHSEPDAYKRTEKIYDLWCIMRDYIKRSQTSGRIEFERQNKQQKSNSYSEGVPENLSPDHGNQSKEPIAISMGENEEGGSEEEDSKNFGKKRGDKIETSQEKEGVGNSKEKAKEGIREEAKQEGGDWSDEIEEIINALGAGDGVDEIAIAEDGEVNQERMQKAKNFSRRTSRIFSRRLQQLNKDKTVQNKEWGDLNSRSLIPAERGSTRIFEQTKESDEKNYNCIIVLDRSGSMNGDIESVELAAGAITWGLEDNGIDTSILDTHSSMTTLSKPFGTSTESFSEKVFSGRVGGGTPLTHTMKFARERMSRGENQYPFAIVITDGMPRDRSSFKEEVSKANFPVLGLYITRNKDSVDDQLSLYDKAVVSETGEDVNQKLINLINSIIF